MMPGTLQPPNLYEVQDCHVSNRFFLPFLEGCLEVYHRQRRAFKYGFAIRIIKPVFSSLASRKSHHIGFSDNRKH